MAKISISRRTRSILVKREESMQLIERCVPGFTEFYKEAMEAFGPRVGTMTFEIADADLPVIKSLIK